MENNMTQGKIWKHILMFSLPIMAGMMLQFLYSTVDGIVVGNFVSDVALGAVNTSSSIGNLFVAIASGLSTGCGVVIAQYYGANRKDDMRKTLSTMLFLMIGMGLLFTVIGELLSTILVRNVLGVPDDAFDYALTYTRIYFIGLVFQFAYNAFAAELRSVGNSRATLYFLLIASLTNIVLDLLFVCAFNWGVAGVAIATVISQAVSAIVSLIYIYKKQPILALSRTEMVFDKEKCKVIFKTGIPITLQTIISQVGSIFMQRLINSFGSSVMAAVAAGQRLEAYALAPVIAFGNGLATFSGQNIGAGRLDRVKKGLFTTLAMSGGLSVALGAIIYILTEPLVGLFGCTGDSLAVGIEYLHFMSFAFVLSAILFVTRGMLQGSGDVTYPTVVTFLTLAFRVAIAYIMAATSIGYKAIWYAMALDFAVGSIFYIIRLASGKWKTKAIVKSPTPADGPSEAELAAEE